ncbi:MAG: ABC transporter permease [Blastocatellia bacterium]|nr:ABC transporter permease [Blastocatellia bacterium]
MDSLVVANVKQRPTRTAVSIIGVALGVVLVMMFAGLVNGMQNDRKTRESSVGADLMFYRDFSLTTTSLTLPTQYVPKLQEVPGVGLVSPVGQYLKETKTGIGFEILEGIDFPTYSQMSGIHIQQGQPLTEDLDVIVDEVYARQKKVTVGSTVDIFSRKFRIAGIFSPPSGSRIKIKLSSLQQILSSPDRCTMIYLKCAKGESTATVAARINQALPDNKLMPLEDLKQLYEKGIPAFNTFLKVVIGLAVIVSLLVILLAMYTTIMERTREIGILKSMGASKGFIVRVIEQEALLICISGVLLGYAAAFMLKIGIMRFTSLQVELEPRWMLYAALIGIGSGLLGALYPAVRAANQDAVKALSYE